tara:strand:+ start:277 stop:579 length:303 start_codon:yes stop_codon:yes gene_type:complete
MAEHFYASTVWDWVVKEDFFETIETLHALSKPENKHTQEIPFIICKVPLPIEHDYQIKEYVPQVKVFNGIKDGKFLFATAEIIYQGNFNFKIGYKEFIDN